LLKLYIRQDSFEINLKSKQENVYDSLAYLGGLMFILTVFST